VRVLYRVGPCKVGLVFECEVGVFSLVGEGFFDEVLVGIARVGC